MSKLITEVSSLSRFALPVALSQLAIIGMGATDVLLVGRSSTGELAALSLGNNIWNIVILFFFGIVAYTLIWGRKIKEDAYWGSHAETLEWTLPNPPPEHTFEILPTQDMWDKSKQH